jgi:cytochrome c oxidase assembly factor CtaG
MLTVPLAVSTDTSAAFQLGPLAILGLLYARRARTLAEQDHPVPGWRQACFYGGFVVIGVALTSLGRISQDLLFVHMIEHLLLGDIAALLIVLGLTGLLLAPVLTAEVFSVRIFDRLRALSHPAVAFPLWVIDLYAWHVPVFYEAALRHSGVHALEHAMFLGFGINMWMCLFGPLPTPSWFGNLGKLIYIVAVRLAGTILGNIFVWSGTVFYPYYLKGDALYHISPLADQSIAGAIMMIEESILTLGLFCWLFLRAAREGEERQDLLDFANARGLELSESRAARAVAAGRGAELRERLEGLLDTPGAPRDRGASGHVNVPEGAQAPEREHTPAGARASSPEGEPS